MKNLNYRIFVIFFVLGLAACAQTTSPDQGTQPQQNSGARNTANATATTATRLPAGTELQVRVNERLSSDKTLAGDRFTGTLASPVSDSDGHVIFDRGAQVSGRVLDSKPSGRFSDSGQLQLTILQISSPTGYVNVNVEPFTVSGVTHTKSNTTKIGGGALLGAIIGGLAGGGKGAAIGTIAGAGAGAGAAAATGKKEAVVEPEAVLHFTLNSDTMLHPGAVPQEEPTLHSRGNEGNGNVADANPGSGTNTNGGMDTASNDTSGDSDRPVLQHRETAGTPVAQNPGDAAAGTGATAGVSASNGGAVSTANLPAISLREKRVINQCLSQNTSKYAAYLRAEAVPQGVSMEKGSVLPASIAESAHPLPLECNQQLSTLPSDEERVIYNRRVMLLDANARVLDAFDLELTY